MSKEYNVLILGPKGSGKTVFLSSMYYQLCMPDEYNFYLETANHQQGKKLKAIFSNLPNEWPEPNQADVIEQWKFKCMLKSGTESHEAFRITYFDYSGGRLTDDEEDDGNKMKGVIDKADIVLGLIDGRLLNEAMKLNNFTNPFYLTHLEAVLQHLSVAHKDNQIVHLLITKWDLLYDNFSVEQIIGKLLEFDRFKKFAQAIVHNGSIGGKIRFIPISSVGFDFAELAEDGINMNIKPVCRLNPYNVEIPLSLALVDPIRKSIQEMIEEEERLKDTRIYVDPDLSIGEKIARGLGNFIGEFGQLLGIKSDSVIYQVANWAQSAGEENIRAAAEKEQRLREELKKRINKVYNAQEAADFVLTTFLANEQLLILEHPNSVIDKNTL